MRTPDEVRVVLIQILEEIHKALGGAITFKRFGKSADYVISMAKTREGKMYNFHQYVSLVELADAEDPLIIARRFINGQRSWEEEYTNDNPVRLS